MKVFEPLSKQPGTEAEVHTKLGERRAHVERACGRNDTLHGEADLPRRPHNLAGDSIRNAEQSPDTHVFSSVFWWAGLVLILYVLSIGPGLKFEEGNQVPNEAIETIYAPIVWLCETTVGQKVVRPALIWYGATIWRWELPKYYK